MSVIGTMINCSTRYTYILIIFRLHGYCLVFYFFSPCTRFWPETLFKVPHNPNSFLIENYILSVHYWEEFYVFLNSFINNWERPMKNYKIWQKSRNIGFRQIRNSSFIVIWNFENFWFLLNNNIMVFLHAVKFLKYFDFLQDVYRCLKISYFIRFFS
jgi:hypothetical protein